MLHGRSEFLRSIFSRSCQTLFDSKNLKISDVGVAFRVLLVRLARGLLLGLFATDEYSKKNLKVQRNQRSLNDLIGG